ncbi:SixA phosphatase family protein [Gordonia crocea]|uniref:Phosphohistidine phosphatase n=1 Tax=Gordonia crocea TaxID=589162 RepID=A0A7I9UZU9_9ACTN|nr:histidine phosphatase family protein [Gordonia crocea]GED98707.1 phosphohistidine phosphatase [Gordonia crocea]
MSRTLVLLRHGKSAYPAGADDHHRPLAPRGISQAALAGQWMRDEQLAVDAVLCSTAKRTRETLKRTGIDAPVQYLDELYGALSSEILEAIRIYAPESAGTLLVVGHMPGMADTALALDPDGDVPEFPTSAYAVLSIGVGWADLGLAVDPEVALHGVRVPR